MVSCQINYNRLNLTLFKNNNFKIMAEKEELDKTIITFTDQEQDYAKNALSEYKK